MLLRILLAAAVLAYALAVARALWRRDLSRSRYPAPEAAEAEIDALARAKPDLCTIREIGRSTEGRPIRVLVLRARSADPGSRPRLLVTAQIHAVEYVGSFVARAVARRLAEGYRRDPAVTALLDRADVFVVPLLNPDGAHRVWRQGGYCGLRGARVTANGIDPNRNFPFLPRAGRGAWNTGRDRPGSAWYRGPHPLSEPECRALADLCERERFRAAVNFHSFGGVVYMPVLPAGLPEADAERLRRAFAVFQGTFQSRQPHLRYRPVPERSAAIVGQLDPFLLEAFGTPSVTVEVSRPGLSILRPSRVGNLFWIANPEDPARSVENDADATIHALALLV